MKSYQELLQKAEQELPHAAAGGERFSIEKVKGHIEGNRTVLSNLKKIARDMRREESHLLKYLLRELAAPGKFQGERAIFGSKLAASIINKKIQKYASEFVYCSECNKPDTTLLQERDIAYLRCQACGAKKPVKKI